jgi:hypothetical protein
MPYVKLRQNRQFNSARGVGSVKKVLCRGFKVLRFRMRDVDERLWIAIYQRKPGTLNLHHNPVAFSKGVIEIGHFEIYLCQFAGD